MITVIKFNVWIKSRVQYSCWTGHISSPVAQCECSTNFLRDRISIIHPLFWALHPRKSLLLNQSVCRPSSRSAICFQIKFQWPQQQTNMVPVVILLLSVSLQDIHDCYLDLFQTHLHFVSNNTTGLTYQVSYFTYIKNDHIPSFPSHPLWLFYSFLCCFQAVSYYVIIVLDMCTRQWVGKQKVWLCFLTCLIKHEQSLIMCLLEVE